MIVSGRRARGRADAPARKEMRITPGAAILAVVIVLLLFALTFPLRQLLDQRSQLAKLQREEQVLLQRNAALREQVQRLNDPVYVQRIARQCLGMVKPGEIAFVVVPKAGQGTQPGVAKAVQPATGARSTGVPC